MCVTFFHCARSSPFAQRRPPDRRAPDYPVFVKRSWTTRSDHARMSWELLTSILRMLRQLCYIRVGYFSNRASKGVNALSSMILGTKRLLCSSCTAQRNPKKRIPIRNTVSPKNRNSHYAFQRYGTCGSLRLVFVLLPKRVVKEKMQAPNPSITGVGEVPAHGHALLQPT